jgi:dihydrofolate synthase/folylpolyglutamate synthase
VLAKRDESDKTLNFDFKLIGTYQLKNIATVLETIHTLRGSKYELSDEQLKAGLETVNNESIAGRWQMIGNDPLVIADTAHNEAGIKYVLDTIATMKYNQLHIVLGVVNDKDLDEILPLFPTNALYYFCKPNILL